VQVDVSVCGTVEVTNSTFSFEQEYVIQTLGTATLFDTPSFFFKSFANCPYSIGFLIVQNLEKDATTGRPATYTASTNS
jgi:hypothetical protein